ncbi:hypothetical protein AB0P21_40840 [Kribbella sp. NPDC056861]|uniref:hypothetical protein n=1 Tax=Kribbella sp. NPDC056861 TaxID=3154857 RepID=UPI0034281247
MRIGILDILALPTARPIDKFYRATLTRQFASVTPQAISVLCRRAGHQTFYATYYGLGTAHQLLPDDLDVVFIASYTPAFSLDRTRFFGLVVRECDEAPVTDILDEQFTPGSIVSSDR